MIDPQNTQLVNPSPSFFEDIETKFQSFHGRMVIVLSPLEENWICDVLTRIAILFASVVVYPAWGTVKLVEAGVNAINACFIKKEKNSNVGVQTENLIQCEIQSEAIKDKIAIDIDLLFKNVNVNDFQGENLQIFITAGPMGFSANVKRNSEELSKSLTQLIPYLQGGISDRYNEQSIIDIKFLVVGELKKENNEELIDFLFFKLSYIGNKGSKKNPSAIFRKTDLKASFIEQMQSHNFPIHLKS